MPRPRVRACHGHALPGRRRRPRLLVRAAARRARGRGRGRRRRTTCARSCPASAERLDALGIDACAARARGTRTSSGRRVLESHPGHPRSARRRRRAAAHARGRPLRRSRDAQAHRGPAGRRPRPAGLPRRHLPARRGPPPSSRCSRWPTGSPPIPEVVRIELGPLAGQGARAAGDRRARRAARARTSWPRSAEGARGNPLHRAGAGPQRRLAARACASPTPSTSSTAPASRPCTGDAARLVRVMAAAGVPLLRDDRAAMSVHRTAGSPSRVSRRPLAGGFVVETGERIAISHELCAEAVEAMELTPERQGIHAALAERAPDEPALAAWHWARARLDRPRHARRTCAPPSAAARLDPGRDRAAPLRGGAGAAQHSSRSARTSEAALLAGAARASASAGAFRRAVALMRRAIESPRHARGLQPRAAPATRPRACRWARCTRSWVATSGTPATSSGAIDSMERALGIMPAEPSRQPRPGAGLAGAAPHDRRSLRRERRHRQRGPDVAARRAEAAGEDDAGRSAPTPPARWASTWPTSGTPSADWSCSRRRPRIAREAGRLDDLMRVAANRTTLLDLDLRREEALAVVQAVPGRGRGRWAGGDLRSVPARQRCRHPLSTWAAGRRPSASAVATSSGSIRVLGPGRDHLALAAGAGPAADRVACRRRGRQSRGPGRCSSCRRCSPAQWTGMVMRAAVSLALWNGQRRRGAQRRRARVAARARERRAQRHRLRRLDLPGGRRRGGRARSRQQRRRSHRSCSRADRRPSCPRPSATSPPPRSGPDVGARHEAELLLRRRACPR